MIVIVSRFLLPKRAVGLTVFPFIILRCAENKTDERLINHEKIHIRQQLELLIIPFYIWYVADFFIKYLKYKNVNQAYLNIVFEREAYAMDHNLTYLKHRKWFSFKNFF